jgi:hypothetical protein
VGPERIAIGYVARALLFAGLCAATIPIGLVEGHEPANRRLLCLALGAAAFSAMHFVSQLMPFWCYLPAYLVLFHSLTHMRLEHPWSVRARDLTVAVSALLGLLLVGHKIHIYRANIEIARGARDFVDRIKEHVPPGGRIYQLDGSGFTGYFSERVVVNGDGLVNTYDYARRLRAGRLAGFLDEQHICYLVLNRRPEGGRLVDFAGLRVEANEVEELLRSSTYGRFPTTDFVLYRRRAAGCEAAPPSPAPTGPPGSRRAPPSWEHSSEWRQPLRQRSLRQSQTEASVGTEVPSCPCLPPPRRPSRASWSSTRSSTSRSTVPCERSRRERSAASSRS